MPKSLTRFKILDFNWIQFHGSSMMGLNEKFITRCGHKTAFKRIQIEPFNQASRLMSSGVHAYLVWRAFPVFKSY